MNFIEHGIRVCQRLLKAVRLPHVTITGQIEDVKNEADIKTKVELYNKNKVPLLLLSSAGQHGLDLHGTLQFFNVDPHWHVGQNRQAEARVIRYNSHLNYPIKHVEVYNYVAVPPKGTLNAKGVPPRTADEYLFQLAKDKEEKNQHLTNLIPKYCIEQTSHDYHRQHLPAWSKHKVLPRMVDPLFFNTSVYSASSNSSLQNNQTNKSYNVSKP